MSSRFAVAAFGLLPLFYAGSALACRSSDLERTIFFASVPETKQPIILQVTITGLLKPSAKSNFDVDDAYSFRALARVDKVLDGVLNRDTIEIDAPATSCDHPLRVGMSGIVAGTITSRIQGDLVLRAIPSMGGKPVEPIRIDERKRR